MRLGLHILTSKISNKIVLPYLVVVICVAIAMTFVTVRFTVGALQERLDNRLIEAGQATSDALVAIENQQLTQLRPMVFTQGVAEALSTHDRATLAALLQPHWINAHLDALIVFDQTGQPLLSWEQNQSAITTPRERQLHDLNTWWIVQQIVAGRSDSFGDKFSVFHDQHLYTAAPVYRNDRIVGGLMIGLPLEQLLERLQSSSQASITTLYDAAGQAVATTHLLKSTGIPSIPADVLAQLQAVPGSAQLSHIQSSVTLNEREYQIAFSPLHLRRATTGFFSVSVSRDFVVDTWARGRLPLIGLALLLIALVVGVGIGISRRITRPLQNLANTARAVSNGALEQRSNVHSHDELGIVAQSFNQMTERLLRLYETSRSLSASIRIDTILTQTHIAVQPFVPGAAVLALLNDQQGWRCYLSADADDALHSLNHAMIEPSTAITALIEAAQQPLIAPVAAQPIAGLVLPPGFTEICCTALNIQDQQIGLLVYLHGTSGAFSESVMMPLAAIASMTATALNNARLYAEIEAEGDQRRAILESIVDGVIVCNAERQVVLMNPAASALLNLPDWQRQRYHFDQLPLTPLMTAGPRLATEAAHERYIAHGRILRVTGTMLPTTGGSASGEVIVLHDISDEAALDQAKTQLIAMISHELRTPLTAIQGAVDLLRTGIGGQLSPIQTELVETALRQTRAINGLIDKAIIVANIETNTLELDIQPTEPGSMIETTIRSLQSAARNAQVELRVDLPHSLPAVMVDARMLQVALEEVIDNAIKYGGGTPVQIDAYVLDDDVVVSIRDEGPGISLEDQKHLFRSLSRGADSLNTAPRGLGLGLVITRELLERQGCAISVESEPGHGSVFSILLPGVSRAVPAQPII
jgi:signal transduction histidine kinase